MKTIIINNVEYETETHDFNKILSEIKIPKGWRLWTIEECINLFNSHKEELNLNPCWFFIEQPFDKFKNKYASRFWALSDGANFDCFWSATVRRDALGVRLCRNIIKNDK